MRRYLVSSVSILAFAFAAPPASAAGAKSVDTIVVTATRTEQPLARTGLSMSIITADDLARQQVSVLTDALARTPGISIVRNGGPGGLTTLHLRGSDAGQTVMLVDGVRLNDPSTTDGQPLLSDLLVNNIERVEILRGSQSTLYGSDAIGGVVNVLTKRGGDKPISALATAEGGSYGTYRLNSAANGMLDALEYGVAVNYLNIANISAAASRNGNTERDGYRNFGATGNLRWHAGDGLSFDLRAYFTDGRSKYDGFPPPTFTFRDTAEFSRNRNLLGYMGVNLDLLDGRFGNRFAILYGDSDRTAFNPVLAVAQTSAGKSRSLRFEYQGVFDLDENNQITFGAETFNTRFSSGTTPAAALLRGSNAINGFYAQWQSTFFETLTLTGGVRYDDDEQFGGHTSLKFAAAWRLFDGGTILRANYGDGFKAPSLFQRYSQFSNPLTTLDPEESQTFELGVDRRLMDGIVLSLTGFQRQSRDQVDFFSCFAVVSPACALRPSGYYYNVKQSRATGLEVVLDIAVSDTLRLNLNYTSLTAQNLTAGSAMNRRPHDMFNASLTWAPIEELRLGLDLEFKGKQFDDVANTRRVAGYLLANLTAGWRLNETFELYGRVENALDTDYQPVFGYGAQGRGFYAGVRAGL